MVKEFMLLLALTVTDPSGEDRDEKFHVLSRHFDTKNECLEFIQSWESIIHSRGKRAVAEMLDPGWKVKIAKVGCVNPPKIHEVPAGGIIPTYGSENNS